MKNLKITEYGLGINLPKSFLLPAADFVSQGQKEKSFLLVCGRFIFGEIDV